MTIVSVSIDQLPNAPSLDGSEKLVIDQLGVTKTTTVSEISSTFSTGALPVFSRLKADTTHFTATSPGPGRGVIRWNTDQTTTAATHLYISLTDLYTHYFYDKATELGVGSYIYLHTSAYGLFQKYLITDFIYFPETDPSDDWINYTVTLVSSTGVYFSNNDIVNIIFSESGEESIHVNGDNEMLANIKAGGFQIENTTGLKDTALLSALIMGAGYRYLVDGAGNETYPIVDFSNATDGSVPGNKIGFGLNTQGVSGRYGRLLFNLLSGNKNYQFPDASGILALILNTAYGIGWSGDTTHAPSADVLYAKLSALDGQITALSLYLGKYVSLSALQTAYPTSTSGHWAIVDPGSGTDAKEYLWDDEAGWVLGSGTAGVTSVFGRTGVVTATPGDYTTAQVTEVTNLYFTVARVLATVMTGISFVTSTAVTAADTLLVAIGKLQAQITANITAISLRELLSNKAIGTGVLTNSDTTYPSEKKVKYNSEPSVVAVNREQIGFLFQNNLQSLTPYTSVGTFTATASGSGTALSGGDTTINNYLYSNYGASMWVNNKQRIEVLPTGTSGFIFIGFQSATGTSFAANLYAAIHQTSATAATLELRTGGTGTTILKTCDHSTTFTSGATLYLEFEITEDGVYLKLTNSSNKESITIYYQTLTTGTTNFYANNYWHTIHQISGTWTVTNHSAYVATYKRPAIGFAGDSITRAYGCNSRTEGFAQIVGSYYNDSVEVYAQPNAKIEELNVTELLLLNAKILFLSIGTNNIPAGDTTTVFGTKLTTLINALVAGGYVLGTTLFVSRLLPKTASNVTTYNAQIDAIIGVSVIDDYSDYVSTGTSMSVADSADGTHPGSRINAWMAEKRISILRAILPPSTVSLKSLYLASKDRNGFIYGNGTSLAAIADKTSNLLSGDWWNSSTQACFKAFIGGLPQSMIGIIFTQIATKIVTNTTTETSLIGTGLPATGNTLPTVLWAAGKTLRIEGGGVYSTLVTPGNLVINVKLGSTVIATYTITNLIASAANAAFQYCVDITCRTTGASGTVVVDGQVDYETAAGIRSFGPLNNAGATTTVNTTGSLVLDVTATWATASTSNSISSTVNAIEILN